MHGGLVECFEFKTTEIRVNDSDSFKYNWNGFWTYIISRYVDKTQDEYFLVFLLM